MREEIVILNEKMKELLEVHGEKTTITENEHKKRLKGRLA